MLIESIPDEPLCFQTLPFNNPKVQLTFQARTSEQKRDWCLQLKNAILDSYQTIIPSHAKQLVLAIGQSTTNRSSSSGNSTNNKQRFHVQIGRKLSAPEYLERRCKAAAAATKLNASASFLQNSSTITDSSILRRKSVGSVFSSNRCSNPSLLTSPIKTKSSFGFGNNSSASIGTQLNALQKGFRLRRSIKKSVHLIGNFGTLNNSKQQPLSCTSSNTTATLTTTTTITTTSSPIISTSTPNGKSVGLKNSEEQLLQSLNCLRLVDMIEQPEVNLDDNSLLSNGKDGSILSVEHLNSDGDSDLEDEEEQSTMNRALSLSVDKRRSHIELASLPDHGVVEDEEDEDENEEDEHDEEEDDKSVVKCCCNCLSCSSLRLQMQHGTCLCCTSGASLTSSGFGLNGSTRTGSFKEDDSGVGSSSSVCCHSLLRFGTPLGSQCSNLSGESYGSSGTNKILWSCAVNRTAKELGNGFVPGNSANGRGDSNWSRIDRFGQNSVRRSGPCNTHQLVRRVHSFTIGHRVGARNSQACRETSNALDFWSNLCANDIAKQPSSQTADNCSHHCLTKENDTTDCHHHHHSHHHSHQSHSTHSQECPHHTSNVAKCYGSTNTSETTGNNACSLVKMDRNCGRTRSTSRRPIGSFGLHSTAHHPLQHTVSFRKTANVDLLLARLRHLHRRPAMVAAAKAELARQEQLKQMQKHGNETDPSMHLKSKLFENMVSVSSSAANLSNDSSEWYQSKCDETDDAHLPASDMSCLNFQNDCDSIKRKSRSWCDLSKMKQTELRSSFKGHLIGLAKNSKSFNQLQLCNL
jgi:hypothetical protein